MKNLGLRSPGLKLGIEKFGLECPVTREIVSNFNQLTLKFSKLMPICYHLFSKEVFEGIILSKIFLEIINKKENKEACNICLELRISRKRK